jgi:NAD(P)-dependent dehydrogenase (short-subunit alcohol dehydrogenase family)
MGRLDGKTAIITGGGGGIGRAAAQLFAREGANVLLVDKNEADLKTAIAVVGGMASYVIADVTDPADTEAYTSAAVDRYGGIDVALLNAGIEGSVTRLVDTPLEVFDQVIAVNVRGVWLGLTSIMPKMAGRGGGSIVITSSAAGLNGYPNVAPYVTSKHAVVGLMKTAALEGAADKIRVNTIHPGPIPTRMLDSLADLSGDRARTHAGHISMVPLKRFGQPDEVARLMLFLGSDESSYCTGGTFTVDGGIGAGRNR